MGCGESDGFEFARRAELGRVKKILLESMINKGDKLIN